MTGRNAGNCSEIQYNLVFACSGAADVGAVADQAARMLSREKTAIMCCSAAIAADVRDIVEKAAFASRIVVIDGCDKGCTKKILDNGGFANYAYVELGALSMEKGKTPANEENVTRVAAAAKTLLDRPANSAAQRRKEK